MLCKLTRVCNRCLLLRAHTPSLVAGHHARAIQVDSGRGIFAIIALAILRALLLLLVLRFVSFCPGEPMLNHDPPLFLMAVSLKALAT